MPHSCADERVLAEVVGGPVNLPTSLFKQIEEGLRKGPDRFAVISLQQPRDHLSSLVQDETAPKSTTNGHTNHECLHWTYRQLHGAALRLVAGFGAHGVKPNMRIATCIPNRVEYHLILWACQVFRLTLCSLDPGATTAPRREELTKYFTDLEPDIVVVLNQQAAHGVDQIDLSIDGGNKALLKIVLDSDQEQLESGSWRSLLEIATSRSKDAIDEEEILDAARNDNPERLSSIIYTSGTSSGKPKGCPRNVGAMAYMSQIQRFDRGYDDSTVYLQNTANFRAICPLTCLGLWSTGGTLLTVDSSAGIQAYITAIRDYDVNMLLFIPALLHMLVAEPEFAQLDVSRITQVYIGADMITREIFTKMQRAFPQAYCFVGHGMSEGSAVVEWPWRGTPTSKIPFFGEICPIGRVSPGSSLRIRDPKTGQTLKRNEPGELCLHGPSIIKTYVSNVQPEAFFTDPNTNRQWFCTGDLAMINDDGDVYIVGRLKDIIKRAGIPITPAALESTIEAYTGSQVSVIAYSHPTLGQEPLVVLESMGGRSADEIREHVLEKFNKDYALGAVLTLQDLGLKEWPLNATGKIMKIDLLECANKFFGKEETSGQVKL